MFANGWVKTPSRGTTSVISGYAMSTCTNCQCPKPDDSSPICDACAEELKRRSREMVEMHYIDPQDGHVTHETIPGRVFEEDSTVKAEAGEEIPWSQLLRSHQQPSVGKHLTSLIGQQIQISASLLGAGLIGKLLWFDGQALGFQPASHRSQEPRVILLSSLAWFGKYTEEEE